MEHYNLHLSFETLRLISQGQDCQVVCPWHPVCLPTGHSRLTPTSTSPPTPRPTSPGWAPSLSLPARPRPWARSFIFRWEQRNISPPAQPRPSCRTLISVVMISTKLYCWTNYRKLRKKGKNPKNHDQTLKILICIEIKGWKMFILFSIDGKLWNSMFCLKVLLKLLSFDGNKCWK